MTEDLFAPLGISNAGFSSKNASVHDLVQRHFLFFLANTIDEVVHLY